MKPAREPVSSRPKPCASLKKPHESCPFAAPCISRRKKNDSGQTPAFPSETSRFAPFDSRAQGFSPPQTRQRSSCPPPSPNLVRTHATERTTRLSATVLPASCVRPPSRRAPNWSSEEAHTWKHHPQPTIPPPRLNRQAEWRRQSVGCISRG